MKITKIKAQNGSGIGRIDIYGEITDLECWGDEVTPKNLNNQLNALGNLNEIEVHIFSNGGDLFAGLAIYAILEQRQETITVYIEGIAASVATVIACAGDRVFINDSAVMMVHNAWSFAGSMNAEEARQFASELDKLAEPMLNAYTKKTGKTKAEVEALLAGDNGQGSWLTAQEAITFGLADAITPSNKQPLAAAALIRPAVFNYQGHKVDVSIYQNAVSKTANIIQNKGEKTMGKKSNSKASPKAEVLFVETVCPNCGAKINLNPSTGEVFMTVEQSTTTDQTGSSPLARKMTGNIKNQLFTIDCPACGEEYIWDTDVNTDGSTGTETTETEPINEALPATGQNNEVAPVIPASASFEEGIRAERERIVALDEILEAFPQAKDFIIAAKQSGMSADVARQNIIKAMVKNKPQASNNESSSFMASLERDNAVVAGMPVTQHFNQKEALTQGFIDQLNNR
jgi:ATP-dependent Clp protease protease subunit